MKHKLYIHLIVSLIVLFILYICTAFIEWDITWVTELSYNKNLRLSCLVCVIAFMTLTNSVTGLILSSYK